MTWPPPVPEDRRGEREGPTMVNRLTTIDEGNVRIIRFEDRWIFDDLVVREAGEQLLAALPPAGKAAIIDFSNVESLSSIMLMKLVTLQRQAELRGVQLRFCEISNTVKDVLRTTNLERMFKIDRNRSESLDAVRG